MTTYLTHAAKDTRIERGDQQSVTFVFPRAVRVLRVRTVSLAVGLLPGFIGWLSVRLRERLFPAEHRIAGMHWNAMPWEQGVVVRPGDRLVVTVENKSRTQISVAVVLQVENALGSP